MEAATRSNRPGGSEGRFFGQVTPRYGAERQGSGCRARQKHLAQNSGAQARRPSQRFVPFSCLLTAWLTEWAVISRIRAFLRAYFLSKERR
jgi:hypothetical protein